MCQRRLTSDWLPVRFIITDRVENLCNTVRSLLTSAATNDNDSTIKENRQTQFVQIKKPE